MKFDVTAYCNKTSKLAEKLATPGINAATVAVLQNHVDRLNAQLARYIGPQPVTPHDLYKKREEIKDLKHRRRTARREGDDDRVERLDYVIERLEGELALMETEREHALDVALGEDEDNPYLLHGEELERAVRARKEAAE